MRVGVSPRTYKDLGLKARRIRTHFHPIFGLQFGQFHYTSCERDSIKKIRNLLFCELIAHVQNAFLFGFSSSSIVDPSDFSECGVEAEEGT